MGGLQWSTLRLDVVGLLAVIGESAMSAHCAITTATKWGLVPRLIPAPQALFRHSRPHRLPPRTQGVTVVGVCSGNSVKELGYFANLLYGIEQLPKYSVRSITIQHVQKLDPGRSNQVTTIPLRRLGPVIILSLLGALASLGILILAIIRADGMAVVAILMISATSSLVGLGSKWTLALPHRPANQNIPKANIMVCGRQGAFLYISCTEEIARELYFGQEECKYMVGTGGFHVLAGVSTFMLMAAVIAMANCTLVLQYALGITYITMNGLYWLAALLPEDWHWHLEAAYCVTENPVPAEPMGGDDKDPVVENRVLGELMGENEDINNLESGNMKKRNRKCKQQRDENVKKPTGYDNFTEALIVAIELAEGAQWVKFGGVAPRNAAWSAWLEEADRIWETGGVVGRTRWKEWNPGQQLKQKLKGVAEVVSSSNTESNIRGEYMYIARS